MYHTRLCKWTVIPAYIGLELERPFGQPPLLSPWGSANLQAQRLQLRLRCQYLGGRASRPGNIPGLHRSLEKTGPALEYAGTFQYPFPYSMSPISTIWLLGPSFPVRSLFKLRGILISVVSSPWCRVDLRSSERGLLGVLQLTSFSVWCLWGFPLFVFAWHLI